MSYAGPSIPEVTQDFVESFQDPTADLTGGFFRIMHMGNLPAGVDPEDQRVKDILSRSQLQLLKKYGSFEYSDYLRLVIDVRVRVRRGEYAGEIYDSCEAIMGIIEIALGWPISLCGGPLHVDSDMDWPELAMDMVLPDGWSAWVQPPAPSSPKTLHDWLVEVQRRVEATWAHRNNATDPRPDLRYCPGCSYLGTPQHDRGTVVVYACERTEGCDFEDQWEVPRDANLAAKAEVEASMHVANIIEDPDIDGGITG